MTKKFIVITTIFNPTDAIKKFAKFNDWEIIVVGDKKTPKGWNYSNITYLSPIRQKKLEYGIYKFLPWNHYSRKMIGYIYAISKGAEIIYDTDDDNIPMDNWYTPQFSGRYNTLEGNGYVNIYQYFSNEKIWPRGFPLNKINTSNKKFKKNKKINEIGIWQFLADGDPDVDAVYRLTINKSIKFKKNTPLVLGKNIISPINSQNTFFRKEMFPLLFLPSFVTFRFTDILRGLIAQHILWTENFKVGFGMATVLQKRNDHDYLKDFESEIPMYLKTEEVVEICKKTINPTLNISKNLKNIFLNLEKTNIICSDEINILNVWLDDVEKAINKSKTEN